LENCKYSIIIPVKNEGRQNVQMTIDSILGTNPGIPFEIVVVDDNSGDGGCDFLRSGNEGYYKNIVLIESPGLGSAGARNLGAGVSRGEIVVFCDAHVTVPPEWLEAFNEGFAMDTVDGISPAIASMSDPGAVGYGQTWNSRLECKWLNEAPAGLTQSPLLPGGCMAFRKKAFINVGGFDRGFLIWGHEDEEISFKMWLFGHPLYVEPRIKVLHLFRPAHPYKVTTTHVSYNFLRMACSHLGEERLAKAFALQKEQPGFESILSSVCLSNVWEQRRDYIKRRSKNDGWFMRRFGINF
jgi:glycosyltransferase involved in cell wall biosynthesis